MSILVTLAGTSYTIPEPGDAFTQSLTDFLNALTTKGFGNPFLTAHATVATSLANAAFTIVRFDTVELDSDGAYNSGTGRYTVPATKPGRYLVAAGVEFNPGASSTDAAISVFQNATDIRHGDRRLTSASTLNGLGVSAILNCAAADVLDVRVLQNTGGAINTSTTAADNWIAIHRLAP